MRKAAFFGLCVAVLLAAGVLLFRHHGGSPTAGGATAGAGSSSPSALPGAGVSAGAPGSGGGAASPIASASGSSGRSSPAAGGSASGGSAGSSASANGSAGTGGSPAASSGHTPTPGASAGGGSSGGSSGGSGGSGSTPAPATSPIVSSPQPIAKTSLGAQISSLTVTCTGLQSSMGPGSSFTMTYTITAKSTIQLALGAALYDQSGNDQADGTGDEDQVTFPTGTSSNSRQALFPPSLATGYYEVDGELWPPNTIGDGNPITYGSCGEIYVQ